MPDMHHWWGNDLTPSPTGDLALVDGVDLGSQRVVRRLMTILGEYLWNPSYGGSLPLRVGDTLDTSLIESVVRSQMALEARVAPEPEPIIRVSQLLNGVFVDIKYVDAETGLQTGLQFDVSA